MIILECEQLSEEWFQAKIGIPSAASFDKIVDNSGNPSKQQQKYMYQLAGEALTGTNEGTYTNSIIQRGIELEPEARQLFEFINNVDVCQVGLCYEDQKRYSCSPDGLLKLVLEGLEIKCPLIKTHIEYMLNPKKLQSDYWQQCQGGLLVTGYEAWHLFSYYPGLKPVSLIIERDEAFLKKLSEELDKFCLELSMVINKLKD